MVNGSFGTWELSSRTNVPFFVEKSSLMYACMRVCMHSAPLRLGNAILYIFLRHSTTVALDCSYTRGLRLTAHHSLMSIEENHTPWTFLFLYGYAWTELTVSDLNRTWPTSVFEKPLFICTFLKKFAAILFLILNNFINLYNFRFL